MMKRIVCGLLLAVCTLPPCALGLGYTRPRFSEYETYLTDNSCAWGDLNCDGQLTDRDIDLFGWASYYDDFYPHENLQLDLALDYNGNGELEISDKDWMVQFLFGHSVYDFNQDGQLTMSGDGADFLFGLLFDPETHGHHHPDQTGTTNPDPRHWTGFSWGDYSGDGQTDSYDAARFLGRWNHGTCSIETCPDSWFGTYVEQNADDRPFLPLYLDQDPVPHKPRPGDPVHLVLSGDHAGGAPGDANLDGTVDATDIDIVGRHAVDGLPFDEHLDVNGDGQITVADSQAIVTRILGTNVGDVDLDGSVVASADGAILLSHIGHDAVHGWADGDLDHDRLVTAAGDGALYLASQNFPTLSNDIAAVPEPPALLMAAVAVLLFTIGVVAYDDSPPRMS